jgi:hypothetical protein
VTYIYRLPEDLLDDEAAPDLPTTRVAPACEEHDGCDACRWCPCYVQDPAGNRPPVAFPHSWWHHGVTQGLLR